MSKIEDEVSRLYSDLEHNDLSVQTIEYDPTGQPNSQNAINRAKLQELDVVFPAPNQLFIDLDNEHSYQMFLRLLQIFVRFVDEDAEWVVFPSKSGLPKRHVHVNLSFNVRDEEQRVMFQAMLGSDRVRELLGYVQAVNGDPHPTLFLEKRYKGLLGTGEELQMQCDILTDDEIPF
jgi:hypothetical protein